MRHPTKKQMQKVIDRFKTVLPYAKKSESLDMGATGVYCDIAKSCGAPHCVGGWYAVASWERKVTRDLKDRRFGQDYNVGAYQMASDLGFDGKYDLTRWAEENPKIWGNKMGGDMFLEEAAWNNAKSLSGIVRHLERVLKRLPK